MDFSYESFEEQSPDAYERVILDALIGDPTLFIRADEVGRSWRIVDPMMQYWADDERADPAVPGGHLGTVRGDGAGRPRRPRLAAAELSRPGLAALRVPVPAAGRGGGQLRAGVGQVSGGRPGHGLGRPAGPRRARHPLGQADERLAVAGQDRPQLGRDRGRRGRRRGCRPGSCSSGAGCPGRPRRSSGRRRRSRCGSAAARRASPCSGDHRLADPAGQRHRRHGVRAPPAGATRSRSRRRRRSACRGGPAQNGVPASSAPS